jgi:GNAT superfamily N-acetyltransferase
MTAGIVIRRATSTDVPALANAYVRPAYRNQGIGAQLVAALLSYADEAGYARVVLSPSQRSIPFYRRAGFGPADALLLREHPGPA